MASSLEIPGERTGGSSCASSGTIHLYPQHGEIAKRPVSISLLGSWIDISRPRPRPKNEGTQIQLSGIGPSWNTLRLLQGTPQLSCKRRIELLRWQRLNNPSVGRRTRSLLTDYLLDRLGSDTLLTATTTTGAFLVEPFRWHHKVFSSLLLISHLNGDRWHGTHQLVCLGYRNLSKEALDDASPVTGLAT